MLSENIILMYQQLVGDNMDSVTEYNLLNQAKDQIEDDREWAYLKAVDQSQSVSSGDTYLTMKNLPSDFGRVIDAGIYVNTDIVPYLQIPFEDRIRWQSISHRYYIDLANAQYGIFGTPTPGVITMPYIKTTPTLAAGVTPKMPSRFHPMLAYKMAQIFYAVDQGSKSIAWDDRWQIYYSGILDSMIQWDAKMQQTAQANLRGAGGLDPRNYPTIIDGMW